MFFLFWSTPKEKQQQKQLEIIFSYYLLVEKKKKKRRRNIHKAKRTRGRINFRFALTNLICAINWVNNVIILVDGFCFSAKQTDKNLWQCFSILIYSLYNSNKRRRRRRWWRGNIIVCAVTDYKWPYYYGEHRRVTNKQSFFLCQHKKCPMKVKLISILKQFFLSSYCTYTCINNI